MKTLKFFLELPVYQSRQYLHGFTATLVCSLPSDVFLQHSECITAMIHQGILFIFLLSLCGTFSAYKLSMNVLSSSLNTINLCPFSNA